MRCEDLITLEIPTKKREQINTQLLESASSASTKRLKDFLSKSVIRRVYHTTHYKNLKSIVTHGLKSHNSANCKVDISNKHANACRNRPDPIFGRSLHDYVPFYFNPRNAFMYANLEIINKLVTLEIDIEVAMHPERLISIGNAACVSSNFTNELSALDSLPKDVFAANWYGDIQKRSIMMSELLIPEVVSTKYIRRIRTKSYALQKELEHRYVNKDFEIICAPQEFF